MLKMFLHKERGEITMGGAMLALAISLIVILIIASTGLVEQCEEGYVAVKGSYNQTVCVQGYVP